MSRRCPAEGEDVQPHPHDHLTNIEPFGFIEGFTLRVFGRKLVQAQVESRNGSLPLRSQPRDETVQNDGVEDNGPHPIAAPPHNSGLLMRRACLSN